MVILDEFNSAVFSADMKFKDPIYVPSWMRMTLEKTSVIVCGKTVDAMKPVFNSNYPYKTKEEERIERYKHEKRRVAFIIEYLKERHPNEDYAERFELSNEWKGELKFHNEETKSCEFLTEDGRHCNKDRGTSCYTCCFNCYTPRDCGFGKCKFLTIKEDMNE